MLSLLSRLLHVKPCFYHNFTKNILVGEPSQFTGRLLQKVHSGHGTDNSFMNKQCAKRTYLAKSHAFIINLCTLWSKTFPSHLSVSPHTQWVTMQGFLQLLGWNESKLEVKKCFKVMHVFVPKKPFRIISRIFDHMPDGCYNYHRRGYYVSSKYSFIR